ncbi:MAG: ATP-dependent helicase [Methanosarcinaceae archaeon]|nr:ATP-dependent helicase [Methanosarcinaceae archaeon]
MNTKIYAPPGCGKTYSLMANYGTMLNNGVHDDEITCTTFRKSAAEDLINKVLNFTDSSRNTMKRHINTIHGICYRLLDYPEVITKKDIIEFAREYGYIKNMKNGISTIDDEESVYSGKLLDLYTWLRNTQTDPAKWYRYPGAENVPLSHDRIPKFIDDYNEYKEKNNKIDYSDMVEQVLKHKIRLDTPFLMVDEFQDLTKQQYDLFKMWAKSCEGVTIAGDPHQSIYGFWGGSPDYFNEWDATEITLHKSYRLVTPIWRFALEVLRRERQYPPQVTTTETDETPIKVIPWDNETPSTAGTEFHLIRCNYQAYPIAERLAKSGRLFGGLMGWDENDVSLFNVILKFRTGAPLSGNDICVLLDNYPSKYFIYNGKKSDFEEYLKSDYRPTLQVGSGVMSDKLCDILLSKNPIAHATKQNELRQAMFNRTLETRKTPITHGEQNRIRILTIHGSKGLEADTVFLHTGITQRVKKCMVIPGNGSQAEARVWYVGITRAKKALYLVQDAGINYEFGGMN